MDRPLGYGDPLQQFFPYSDFINPLAYPRPNVIVIDDGGLVFRHNTQKGAWPIAFGKTRQGTRMDRAENVKPRGPGRPVKLSGKFQDRLVVVASNGDIRREEVQVSRGTSWERTAMNLADELCTNSAIQGLLACRHLIVSFGTEGALRVDGTDNERRFRL